MSDAYPSDQDILISDQASSLLQLIIDRGGSCNLIFSQAKNRYDRNQILNLFNRSLLAIQSYSSNSVTEAKGIVAFFPIELPRLLVLLNPLPFPDLC